MSLVNLAHVCSHLQNASKARLGLTSIPASKMHAALMLQLQKQGFLSSVTLGGPRPPLPSQFRPNPSNEPNMFRDLTTGNVLTYNQAREMLPEADKLAFKGRFEPVRIEDVLPEEPWKAYEITSDDIDSGSEIRRQSVPTNPAQRRLWLGLKYWENQPVLSKMSLVSKPTKRIYLNHVDLGTIARGREAGYVKGLTKPGECLFVTTDRGILEARECVETKTGGMVLCRVL